MAIIKESGYWFFQPWHLEFMYVCSAFFHLLGNIVLVQIIVFPERLLDF